MKKKFMEGRNGFDQLSFLLLVIYFGCVLFATRTPEITTAAIVLHAISLVSFGLYVFRTLSKNVERRQRENETYLRVMAPIRSTAKKHFGGIRDAVVSILPKRKPRAPKPSKYKEFICPRCNQRLKAPRGKGKFVAVCPRCKINLEMNT